MIASRPFVVDAVGKDLPVHLFHQPRRAVVTPAARFSKLGSGCADREQPYQVRQVMIARRPMRELEIRADEPPVRDQHLQNQLNRLVGNVR